MLLTSAMKPDTPQRPRPAQARAGALAKCALSAGSLLLALVGCELVLRCAGQDMTPPAPLTAYLPRPWGSVMAPNAAPGMINTFGSFDVECTLAKPAGTYRIAILGDSFLGLPSLPHAAQTPQLLAKALNRGKAAENRHCYEVLNFSVSSAGTATEYLRYRHDARRFGPDLVLVFFTISNDMRNNSVVLQPRMEACPIALPGFVLDDAGQLQEVTMPPAPGSYVYYDSEPSRWLVQHSALYGRATRAWQTIKGAQRLAPPAEQWAITASFLRSPPTPEVADAWTVTAAVLMALKSAVEKDGARLAVVLVPTSWDVEPKWKQWFYDQLPPSCPRASLDFDLPYAEALRRLKQQAIPALDLRSSFCSAFSYDPKTNLYDDTGHWNRQGHVIASETTAAFVGDLLARDERHGCATPHSED